MTILDTLADRARARTERNKERVSLDEMKNLALSMDADTGYPFEKALGAPIHASISGQVTEVTDKYIAIRRV